MAKLRQIFEMTAGAEADALLATPDLTYVLKLLRDAGETLCVDDLEQLYAEEKWEADRTFTWLELQALQHKIQKAAVNADRVNAEEKPTDSAHEHLHPGPGEDAVRAGFNDESTLPRELLVAEKDSPQEVLPAFPVDVEGANAEEQARRHTLLQRAIPADLAFAESLIATEYTQFLQGQPVEVRSYLPPSPSALSATTQIWKSQYGRERTTSRPNVSSHIFLSIPKTAVSTSEKKSGASHGYKS